MSISLNGTNGTHGTNGTNGYKPASIRTKRVTTEEIALERPSNVLSYDTENPIPPMLRDYLAPYNPDRATRDHMPKGYILWYTVEVLLTPELAGKMQSALYYALEQRIPEPKHVSYLKRQFKPDRRGYTGYKPGTMVEFACEGDEFYMINCNHSMVAFSQMDAPYPFTFRFYRMVDKEAMGVLFQSIDYIKGRTTVERSKLMPKPYPKNTLPKQWEDRFLNTPLDISNSLRYNSSKNERRGVLENQPYVDMFGMGLYRYYQSVMSVRTQDPKIRERLKCKSLITVGTLLYHYVAEADHKKLDDFFAGIKDWKELCNPRDARRVLGEILSKNTVHDFGNVDYLKVVIFRAWNAWYKGDEFEYTVKSIRDEADALKDEKIEVPYIRVAGTPIDNRYSYFDPETMEWVRKYTK